MDEGGASRWHISYDVTIPKKWRVDGSKNRIIVPLGSLRKGALRRVDAAGGGAATLSILETEENTKHTVQLLMSLAQSFLEPEVVASPDCRIAVETLVRSDPHNADEAIKEFDSWIAAATASSSDTRTQKKIDFFRNMAFEFATNFLLLVEVNADVLDTRTVIKYSRDDDPPEVKGSNTHEIAWAVPDFGMSGSYHLEVEVPRGLTLSSMRLVQYDSDDTCISELLDIPSRPRSLAHLACRPDSRLATAQAKLTLLPAEQGLYTFARMSGIVVFVVTMLAWIVALLPGVVVSASTALPSSAVSVILAAPALLLSWVSRAPEHEIVALILRPYRKMLLASASTLVMLACAAAIPFVFPWSQLLWAPIVAIQTWAFGLAVSTRRSELSPASHTLDEKEGEQSAEVETSGKQE